MEGMPTGTLSILSLSTRNRLFSLPPPESQYTPFPPEPQKEFLQDQTHPFRPFWLLSRYTQR